MTSDRRRRSSDVVLVLFVLAALDTVAAQVGQQLSNKVLQTAVSCDEKFIYFRVSFDTPFQGLIYTENGFPNCVYVNGSVQTLQSYDIKIPLDSCLTRQQPNRDYENSVIIQDNPSYLESSDRKYLLTCVPGISNSRDGSFTVNFGGVTVQGSLPSTEVVKGSGSADEKQLDYSVEILSGWGPNGRPLVGSLNVGDNIAYVVRIPDVGGSDARIGRCWAKDNTSEIELSDDRGCSLQTTGNVWGSFKSENSGAEGRVFYNDIKAWAFPTSNKVNILCNLHLCAGQCQQPQCSTRRAKRSDDNAQADEADKAVETLEAGFRIANSLRQTDQLWAESPSFSGRSATLVTAAGADADAASASASGTPEEEAIGHVCISKLHFAAGIAFMLIIVIAALVFLAFLAYRLHSPSSPYGLKYDDDTESRNSQSRISAVFNGQRLSRPTAE